MRRVLWAFALAAGSPLPWGPLPTADRTAMLIPTWGFLWARRPKAFRDLLRHAGVHNCVSDGRALHGSARRAERKRIRYVRAGAALYPDTAVGHGLHAPRLRHELSKHRRHRRRGARCAGHHHRDCANPVRRVSRHSLNAARAERRVLHARGLWNTERTTAARVRGAALSRCLVVDQPAQRADRTGHVSAQTIRCAARRRGR